MILLAQQHTKSYPEFRISATADNYSLLTESTVTTATTVAKTAKRNGNQRELAQKKKWGANIVCLPFIMCMIRRKKTMLCINLLRPFILTTEIKQILFFCEAHTMATKIERKRRRRKKSMHITLVQISRVKENERDGAPHYDFLYWMLNSWWNMTDMK